MLLACHNLYPSLRPYTTPFFQLSYQQPSSQDVYTQGWDDIYFVISSAFAFTAIRAIAIDWVFTPVARKAGLKRKASVRFAEQGWLCVYYGFFWTFGMVISSPLPPRYKLSVVVAGADELNSISGHNLPTGSTSRRSGRSGRIVACRVV